MKVVQLGEVASFQGGSQPAKSNFVYQEKKGFVRFIQIRDFKNEKNLTYIPESKKNRLCEEGDILIGRYGASVGQILTGLSGAYNVALIKASPNESLVIQKFFYYYLMSEFFQSPLLNVSKRSAQSGFTKEDICSFLIPLPSISQQKVTVEKLDRAFAEINSLEKNLQSKEEKTNQLLQSMLSSAFNQTKEKNTKIRKLGEIAKIGYGFTAKSSLDKGQVKFLRITDIQNGNVNWETVPKCDISSADYLKFKLNKQDIVFARTGATTGKSFKIDSDIDAVFASYLIRLVPDQNIVIPDFIKFYFNTSVYWSAIQSGLSGSAQGGFNATKLSELTVPIPLISEQLNVLKKLEIMDLDAKIKISNIRKQIKGIEELRQSILSNAFNFQEKVA